MSKTEKASLYYTTIHYNYTIRMYVYTTHGWIDKNLQTSITLDNKTKNLLEPNSKYTHVENAFSCLVYPIVFHAQSKSI